MLLTTCSDVQLCSINGVPKECWSYICTNGVAYDGLIDDQNAERCTSCTTPGYVLDATETCVQANNYTCPNGTPRDGTADTDSAVVCAACATNYQLI